MSSSGQIGKTTVTEHVIETTDALPIKGRNYRVSQKGHELIEDECQKMLDKGVIRESFSPWSSPVVLVHH